MLLPFHPRFGISNGNWEGISEDLDILGFPRIIEEKGEKNRKLIFIVSRKNKRSVNEIVCLVFEVIFTFIHVNVFMILRNMMQSRVLKYRFDQHMDKHDCVIFGVPYESI